MLVEIFTNISIYEHNSMVKMFFEHPNGENAPIYAPGPEAVAWGFPKSKPRP